MSPLANLKHDLANRLREIMSSKLIFAMLAKLGPFGPAPDADLATLGKDLETQLAEQSEMTASLGKGCDYFTLIREVRTLRTRIEETRMALDTFLEWAQNGAASDTTAQIAAAQPPFA
jgi:hypothetical protein